MVVGIATRAREKGVSSPDLLTRSVGRIMYDTVRDDIAGVREGETLVLDFAGIKVIDSSFIDEMLVRLLVDARVSPRHFYVKLRGLSEIAELNIDLVLRSYSTYKSKKIVVITENICQNNAFYIGPLSDRERDIVAFMRVNKTATVAEIARFTGLSIEDAGSCMTDLNEMGAVRAEGGGTYTAV